MLLSYSDDAWRSDEFCDIEGCFDNPMFDVDDGSFVETVIAAEQDSGKNLKAFGRITMKSVQLPHDFFQSLNFLFNGHIAPDERVFGLAKFTTASIMLNIDVLWAGYKA